MKERGKKTVICEKCNCEMVFKHREKEEDIYSCVNENCVLCDKSFIEEK